MYIPYVSNASSDWILFPSAIRCDTECWIQRRTGNTTRLLLLRSTFCTFLRPLRKILPSPEMLLLLTYKFTRQHFNEHSPGSDANLLLSKFSVDIFRIPLNAPTSMRSRHIPPKLYSYKKIWNSHQNDVIMSAMASQITNLTIVCSTVYSGADQRKHQSSASLAFVRGIHRWPVNSPHKRPVTRKMFPFDDVVMTGAFYHLRCPV